MSHGREFMMDTVKATPVALVAFGQWVTHVDWQPWVFFLTVVYTGFLLVEKLYKGWKWLRAKRAH